MTVDALSPDRASSSEHGLPACRHRITSRITHAKHAITLWWYLYVVKAVEQSISHDELAADAHSCLLRIDPQQVRPHPARLQSQLEQTGSSPAGRGPASTPPAWTWSAQPTIGRTSLQPALISAASHAASTLQARRSAGKWPWPTISGRCRGKASRAAPTDGGKTDKICRRSVRGETDQIALYYPV